jgi:hypothetical protein
VFKKSPLRPRTVKRLSTFLAVCAVAIVLATAGVLAQKSKGVVGPSRRISGGSDRTRGNKGDQVNKTNKAQNRTYSGANLQDPITGVTVGVPATGERGIERTTAEIMQAQLIAPPSSRPLKPEHEIEGRQERPQDPNAPAVASLPDGIALGNSVQRTTESSAPSAPQPVGLSFDTVTGPTETGAFPPDTQGAIGPTQFFVFLNGRLRTFNKTSGAADGVVNVDSDVFFASVMTPPPPPLAINFTSDPQVRYDRLSGRWILIIIDVPSANSIGDTANRILIAVSDAASAGVISGSTVWTFYFVQQNTVGPIASTGEFLDYPSLGVDANALYIGGDMFDAAAGGFNNTAGFVVRKSSILSGGPVVTTAFRNLIGTDGMLDPRGVDNYNPAATEGYFIGVSAAAFSRLIMNRVSTPGGTPTLSANVSITVPLTTLAISVNHLGNTGGTNGRLDGIDDRLYAAHIRNGRLWTAHSFTTLNSGVASTNAANRRMSVRWYELIVPPTVGTPTINQSGTIFDSTNVTQATARQYWFPSVMVSGQGHAAIGYSTAGTPFRIDTATNGRLVGDALGTTGAVNIYSSSSTAYNPPGDPGPPRRWGDYSATSLDPLDDMTMWTIQQYCNATNTYGARVAKLSAPLPATPSSVVTAEAVTNTVPQGRSNYFVTINGTAVSGSGFYDPGANLAPPALPFNHVSVTLTGAGTPPVVNSTTFINPTTLTMRINTVGASVGPYTLNVTNPDGQVKSSASPLLTVTGPTAAPAAISGQVATPEGVPLAGVTINLGGVRPAKTITDGAGNYRFDNVNTDNFYTVSPSLTNYHFSPGERSFSLLANKTDAVFTGSRDAVLVGNAIDTSEYFVRQHYVDFLGREPDESGFNFWSNQMLECGGDARCFEQRRINVSAAYFLSIEFQETGGLVDRLYRASFGRAPLYAEFMPDSSAVARSIVVGRGDWSQQLATNKQSLIDGWVERSGFKSTYEGLSNAAYVDKLIANTRVTFTTSERDALVNSLGDGSATRAAVLRRIVEDERFVKAKLNEAFVMMEYFGYLRRDPDESGYKFWLQKLNEFHGNFVQAEMVKAFINSAEYRQRFGF